MGNLKVAGWTVLVVACAGCAEASEPRPEPVQSTTPASIVTSAAPAWASGEEWRVDTVAVLEVGVQDGPAEYQLFRMSQATRLDDGTLVAGNSGSSELRFYDAAGRFIRAVGGQGKGPGEFSEFSSLRLCPAPNGRLLVSDDGNDRINVYTNAGVYEATLRLPPAGAGRPPNIVGCLGNGQLVGISWPDGGVLRGDPGEVIEGEMDYIVIDGEGKVASTIARVHTRPRFVNEAGGRIHYPFIPFMPEAVIAVGGDAVFLATDGTAAVERRAADGTSLGAYRWQGPKRTAVRAVWKQYVDWALDDIGDDNDRRRYATFYAQDLPLPDSAPALQALKVDAAGNLWAERYRLPWDSNSVWDVLDPRGAWLGTVDFPDRLTVFEIGQDYILARHVDELGVERLVLYRLLKR